ncbi:MAG: alkaline phosphatase [Pontixanthobacter sp.]
MTRTTIAATASMFFVLAGCTDATSPRGLAVSQTDTAAMAVEAARAKNVILFIGDGMGVSTVTAARIYDGQSRGETGEENVLSFERLPSTAIVKTYNTNQQVSDSAGTATAMTTGVKTRAGVLNVGPSVQRGNCAQGQAGTLRTIGEELAERGKAIGIVSTARLTHATPAAVYGHTPERDWESDSDVPATETEAGCTDLARQMLDFPFHVALGGGSAPFYGNNGGGNRTIAAADLPADWAARTGGHIVTTRAELAVLPNDDAPVLGLFSPSHMQFMLEKALPENVDRDEPTLTEMTTTALSRLGNDPDGYFLMVEGGRIDHGHHAGRAALALSETQEFARAVQATLNTVDLSETLVLVTADHSHVFTMAGYPTRGNPILGLVRGNDRQGEPDAEVAVARDGQPYTTLGYANGPGAIGAGPRQAPDTQGAAVQQALIPTGSETHGGEDVVLYAAGPGSDQVRGVIEQNRIHAIMMRALGLIGD